MPRRLPDVPVPVLKEPELETWTLTLKTITPMFGGSATVREMDADNPVRAASVRGHLRFWWRATAGARYESAKELFKAEEEIWGSAEKQGKVTLSVVVTEQGKGKTEPCCSYYHPTREGKKLKTYPYFGRYPGYALFPFQGKARKDKSSGQIAVIEEPTRTLIGCEFSVCIRVPKAVKQEVWNAIAAWIKFGGIGSRTRRGCGSLNMLRIEPENNLPEPRLIAASPTKPITTLQATYLLKTRHDNSAFDDPIEAWKVAVDTYRDFRQGLNHARYPSNDRKKPAGRSKYPEADTIRRLFPSPDLAWKHPVEHIVSGFPRADLGLPILFHFTEEGPQESFVLAPSRKDHKRFASPVITKAVAVSDGYVGAIVMLKSPHIWNEDDLELTLPKDKRGRWCSQTLDVPRIQVQLTSQDLKNIFPLNGVPIREALLEFAKNKGFKEVEL